MDNNEYTPEEFERAVKAFYFVTYGKSYHVQRTRTLKVAIKRFLKKNAELEVIIRPRPGTDNAYLFIVVNLHRHWLSIDFKKLPPPSLSLPMPDIHTSNKRTSAKLRAVATPAAFVGRVTHETKAEFYESWEWKKARYQVLQQHGPTCMLCRSTREDFDLSGKRVRIVVDHIKPLHTHWGLRLEPANLQILCHDCNKGKGAWDQTDWRAAG